jgi:hypothetical protein
MHLARPILAMLACAAMWSAENAALAKYGAQITITCDNPKQLNDRWAKAQDLLKSEKPAGPIINVMASAKVHLTFPTALQVRRIALAQMGHKDGWTRASQVEVRVGGKTVHTAQLDVADTKLQGFEIPTVKTAEIELVVTATGPADAKVAYGGFSQVQVVVDEDLATLFAAPDAGIERTAFAMTTPNLGARPPVPVIGTPRKAAGHPCTIWDAEDIAELKRQIAEVPAAKDAFQRCVAFCEQAVAKPVQVPEKPDDDTDKAVAAGHTTAVAAIANMGIGYALSGDERYAKEVRRMLLRYADLYEAWPVHGSPNFHHDQSKWSWQRLSDAIWLIQAAWGYDLVYASPSLSEEDRAKINDHFMKPCVDNILRSNSIIAAPTNWSAICCAAVMVASRVSGYEEKYRWAVDGLPKAAKKPAKKGVAAAPAPVAAPDGDVPSGNRGGIYFYIDNGIDDDGMWAEGAIGYQFMAMRGLLVMAETLWHDGIDVYGYRNSRLKLVFDSPIWYCYPGGTSSPAIHDSGSASLFGRDAHLYQYALRRYGDRTYNAILSRVVPSLASVYNLFLPAFDFRSTQAADLPVIPSILFPGVGFPIARTGFGEEQRYLLMDYGPNRSHGHPDKLNHCLYALGQELYADGGSAWYSTDVYKYYDHTLAHNTVLANGQSQIASDGRLEAYCQAGELALIRATANAAIPSTGLDRTLVLLGDRLYDIYQVRSGVPCTFDLPLHSHGTLQASTELEAQLQPWPDEQRSKGVYTFLSQPRSAVVAGDWSCSWQVPRGRMELHAIGEAGTEVVLAKTPKGGSSLGMAMLRRTTADTVYATVSDIIPNGREASVLALRSLRGPQAEGLEADLAGGGRETVLVNRGIGSFTVGGYTTDAAVAVIRRQGDAITALIVSGGTSLRGPGLDLGLSTPGLVSVYSAKDGLMRCTNHAAAAVELTWQGLAATQVASLGADGMWTGRAAIAGGRFSVPAGAGVDLSNGGDESVAAYENAQRRAKQQAAWDAEQLRLQQQAAAMAALRAAAAREPAPADALVIIEAETPAAQGGGEASFPTNKTGARGTSLSGWNNRGHWVEYTCEVAHTGWYQVALKYCLEGEEATRSLLLDGKPLHADLEQLVLPGTGGWSNGADQWSLVSASLPGSPDAMVFRLEQGRHTIRLENTAGGGLNLDYIVLAPAQVALSRAMVEKP